jgi:nucleoid-associated protein YgaU
MMRKDVKAGLAIGGVLLAVVVVYVLVGTGNHTEPNGAGIVTEDTSGVSSAGNTSKPNDSIKSDPVPPVADSSKPTHDVAPPTIKSDPPAPTTGPSVTSKGATDAIASAAVAHDANSDLWDKTLTTGQLMLSQTPTPANPNIPGGGVDRRDDAQPAADKQSADRQPHDSEARASGGPATPTRAGSNLTSVAEPPATAPSRTTTHVVQKDETLVLISKAIYGSPNYYPHILRANPGLDPKKLKPGMTINIPPVSDVKPDANGEPGSAGGSQNASTIDPHKEYRVQQNDTLERIAVQLYGKREMWTKLYELNKDKIGPNPAKLKLHQVLQLPEPPTQTASR